MSRSVSNFAGFSGSICSHVEGMTGSVSPLYEAGAQLRRAGVVPGYYMTSEAALSKLSYLLALPHLSTSKRIQMMTQSIRGEITEQANVTFEHPARIPATRESLTSLGYAISGGDVVEVKRLLKGDAGWLLNESDYAGNTPLVSIEIPTIISIAWS